MNKLNIWQWSISQTSRFRRWKNDISQSSGCFLLIFLQHFVSFPSDRGSHQTPRSYQPLPARPLWTILSVQPVLTRRNMSESQPPADRSVFSTVSVPATSPGSERSAETAAERGFARSIVTVCRQLRLKVWSELFTVKKEEKEGIQDARMGFLSSKQ